MFCTQCGKQNPDGTKFCIGCGAELIESYVTSESTVIIGNTADEQPVSNSSLSTTAMVLGIVSAAASVGSCCMGSWSSATLGLSIAALIISIIARSKAKAKGIKDKKANVGFYCGIGAIIFNIIMILVTIVFIVLVFVLNISLATLTDAVSNTNDYYYYFISRFMR